jgi:hypothetical protein
MSPGQISRKRPDALPPKASEEMAVSAQLSSAQLSPGWGRLLRPPTEAALLGFHRTVAEIAVKVAAITGLDNLRKRYPRARSIRPPAKAGLRRFFRNWNTADFQPNDRGR